MKPPDAIVVRSFAVSFVMLSSLPPDTVAVFVTFEGALLRTLTVSVMAGATPSSRSLRMHVTLSSVQAQPLPLREALSRETFALAFDAMASRLRAFSRSSFIGATLLVVLAAPWVSGAGAEPLAGIPNPRVKDGTWVTDMPRALRADTVARLNQTIGDIQRTHGIEMAVVVVRSLDGLSIEEVAEKLFKLWGIGKKDRDNGLLFLWSTGDRKVRVEVGYGLEGVLPDGKVGAILDAYVIPRFKTGEFDAGIIAGVDAVVAAARSEAVALPAMGTESYDAAAGCRGGCRRSASIPVGIGAITGFRRWRRYRRRNCPQCHDADGAAVRQRR